MNKDNIYINIAKEYAKFSKCISINVGCIIVNESGKIISSGVNGSLPKQVNCCDNVLEDRSHHHEWSNKNEIHAEMNAIIELSLNSSLINSKTISFFVTHSPCSNCLKHILGLQRNGIKIDKIVYGKVYHRSTKETELDNFKKCENMGVKYYELRG